MRVTIFGTGYVGLVTGTCLADLARTHLNLDRAEALLNGCGALNPPPEMRAADVTVTAMPAPRTVAKPRGSGPM